MIGTMAEIVTSSTPDSATLLQLLAQRDAEIRAKDLLIEKLKLQIANLRRHRFGSKSEALDHVIEQLELTLEEIEASNVARTEAANPEHPAEAKAQPKREPLPDYLPREEVVLSPGDTCHQCGGRLRKIGEDITEILEYVPARFKVIRTVRPKLTCRCCDGVLQVAAPVLPIDHGRPGSGLLAHVLVSKYADHLPLYRQSQIYGREGVDLGRSTLADWIGKSTALLSPLVDAIGRHVMAGTSIHADDTPVNVLAPGTGRTRTGRLWVYLRDEHDWGSTAPPAAWYRFTEDRKGKWPREHLRDFEGWLHADGYAGFEDLYRSGRIKEVACLAHVRRKFFDIHLAQGSGIAKEALERIAELYQIEETIKGKPPGERQRVRHEQAAPRLDSLEQWLRTQLTRISGKSALADAIRYGLTRLQRLRPYLEDGRLAIDTDVVEQPLSHVFCGLGGLSALASTMRA